MRILAVFFAAMLVVLSGCTNVAGDAIRVIEAEKGDHSLMLSSIQGFLEQNGYQCTTEAAVERVRCEKELRDLYIHQTRAVLEIIEDTDEGSEFLVLATRWDEGLIPGELISSEFHNPDVVAMCDDLVERALGECRIKSLD